MTIINMRPIGWGEMTPRQWGTIRDMIQLVCEIAKRNLNIDLMLRTEIFLANTEGFDV